MSPESTGPFVAMAVLCDRVEPREDGSVDVFGIVDGVLISPHVRDDPIDIRPVAEVQLQALVSLRAGAIRGPRRVSLQGVYPSGKAGPEVARAVDFTDALPGANFVVPLELQVHEPGLYGFDVRCEGRLLTRIELQVQYA